MNNDSSARSSLPLFLWLGYVFFVVYAGLVPLQYRARPLDEAWVAFQQIPFVDLSIDLHADLIANGVLFIPVAFLTTYLLTQTFRKAPFLLSLAIAGAFSVSLVVAVEFTQLFFPPRTVKLNDILSEWLGSLVGLALSTRYANWFQMLVRAFWNDTQRLKMLLLEGYAFAYLAFSLFPYDILSSWPDLLAKIDSNTWGWFAAADPPRLMLIGIQLLAEVVLTSPLGILLGRLVGVSLANYKRAALAGILLGGFIEVAQFFLYSGISQGLSVLSRGLGVCCGVALCKHSDRWTADHVAFMLRRHGVLIGAVYLFAFLHINRWFVSSWRGLDFAAAQLAQVNFVPFYYHYYAGEAQALFSLLAVCLSYVPIALLAWAYWRSTRFAVVLSLLLAMCVEASKLFFQPGHSDPTNLLLACAASWVTVSLMRQLFQKERRPVDRVSLMEASGQGLQPFKGFAVWLLLCLAGTGVWAASFPAFPVLVCLVLIACATTVWNHPVLVFAIIPAALPVFDLAPWSGRFFWDEFDALLLVSLLVAYSRVPTLPRSRSRADVLLAMAVAIVVLSFVISTLRGMRPFALPDANSFNNYYSPYNALRIVKGALWAALAYGLARRFVAGGVDARHSFCWGMTVGLGLTVAVMLWERVAFSGLWNFSGSYRVTGPFSATHTGGAYVDCYLAAAVPFLLVLTLETRHWLVKLAGMLLILVTTYAMMVTFSRGGYLAFAVAVFIVLLASTAKTKRFVRSGVIVVGLASAMLMVAVPILKGEFAQSRIAAVGADLAFRQAHWADALNIRDPGWATSLFGMGLGRFPEAKYWRSTLDTRAGTYQLKTEAENTYLRLGSGAAIGVEQFVSLEPGRQYVLKLDVRPSRPDAKITVPICEKWLLTSDNCLSPTFDLGKEFGVWRSIEASFSAEELSTRSWYSQRPVKLSLTYAAQQSTIDIDNVRLGAEGKTNLLRNGDFSQGLDHWFFATAGTPHAQWRVDSMFYGVIFDQGWFGFVALGTFFVLALGRGAKKAWRGDAVSGAAVAALSGFLVGGLFDTQIDTPRFLMLLLLLVWACCQPVVRSNDRLKQEGTLGPDELRNRFRVSLHDELLKDLAQAHGAQDFIERCPTIPYREAPA